MAVLVVVLVFAAFKSGLVFAHTGVETSGLFLSKHLHLSMTFPEPWLHAPNLDDRETTKDGYKRSVSVFYQGKSSSDFDVEIAVVAFEAAEMSGDLLGPGGPAEIATVAEGRSCKHLDDGRTGFRCESFTARGEQGFGTLEEYFQLGTRIVLVRGLVPAAPGAMDERGELSPASPPDYGAIERVAKSIEAYDPK